MTFKLDCGCFCELACVSVMVKVLYILCLSSIDGVEQLTQLVLGSKKRSESTSVLGFDSFCPVTDNPTGRGGSRGVTLAVPVM